MANQPDIPEIQYYPIPLVGEQYYRAAVARCRVGDIVDIFIESDNPFDAKALVARRQICGATLGYIARDSFVQSVVHDEGGGIAAAVRNASMGHHGFREIVLLGSIQASPARHVAYRPDDASEWHAPPAPQPAYTVRRGANPIDTASAKLLVWALIAVFIVIVWRVA
jgi:hypothetical protein